MNRSITKRLNSLHQRTNSSQRKTTLFFCTIGKKYRCIYKTKKKLAHQSIIIRWCYFWYTPFRRFLLLCCLSLLLKLYLFIDVKYWIEKKVIDISFYKSDKSYKSYLISLLYLIIPYLNIPYFVGNKGKVESQNGCFKETKHAKFPEKRTLRG